MFTRKLRATVLRISGTENVWATENTQYGWKNGELLINCIKVHSYTSEEHGFHLLCETNMQHHYMGGENWMAGEAAYLSGNNGFDGR